MNSGERIALMIGGIGTFFTCLAANPILGNQNLNWVGIGVGVLMIFSGVFSREALNIPMLTIEDIHKRNRIEKLEAMRQKLADIKVCMGRDFERMNSFPGNNISHSAPQIFGRLQFNENEKDLLTSLNAMGSVEFSRDIQEYIQMFGMKNLTLRFNTETKTPSTPETSAAILVLGKANDSLQAADLLIGQELNSGI